MRFRSFVCFFSTPADVKAALAALSDVIVEKLSEGDRVHLEGVGYFQMTLDCAETRDPRETHAQNVHFKSVKFRADSLLKNAIAYRTDLQRSEMKLHSSELSDIEVDGKLIEYFEENRVLTRTKFERRVVLRAPWR